MTDEELLALAGAAALAGSPGEALAPLETLLSSGRQVAPSVRNRGEWLNGVALGALGRYAQGLAALEPLLDPSRPGSVSPVDTALAAATTASLLRQIGDHPAAEPVDRAGLAVLAGVAADAELTPFTEARLDCLVGLTADAVGMSRLDHARTRLQEARHAFAALSPADRRTLWRPAVRLHWVEAEVALLAGQAAEAAVAAEEAVVRAEAVAAPRHLAKSLMFAGVARGIADGPHGDVRDGLARAAGLADQHGLLPLVWPIRAVLATMPGLARDPEESAAHLARAKTAIREIAAGLPENRLARWQADPMAAFLLQN